LLRVLRLSPCDKPLRRISQRARVIEARPGVKWKGSGEGGGRRPPSRPSLVHRHFTTFEHATVAAWRRTVLAESLRSTCIRSHLISFQTIHRTLVLPRNGSEAGTEWPWAPTGRAGRRPADRPRPRNISRTAWRESLHSPCCQPGHRRASQALARIGSPTAFLVLQRASIPSGRPRTESPIDGPAGNQSNPVWSKNSNVADVTCYAPTPGSNFGPAALLWRDPRMPTGEQLSPRLSFWTLRGTAPTPQDL